MSRSLPRKAEPLLRCHLELERPRHVNAGVGLVSESLGLLPALEAVGLAAGRVPRRRPHALAVYAAARQLAARECGPVSAEVPNRTGRFIFFFLFPCGPILPFPDSAVERRDFSMSLIPQLNFRLST